MKKNYLEQINSRKNADNIQLEQQIIRSFSKCQFILARLMLSTYLNQH